MNDGTLNKDGVKLFWDTFIQMLRKVNGEDLFFHGIPRSGVVSRRDYKERFQRIFIFGIEPIGGELYFWESGIEGAIDSEDYEV